jgi:hypothetical protein
VTSGLQRDPASRHRPKHLRDCRFRGRSTCFPNHHSFFIQQTVTAWDYLTADTEGRRLYVSHDREVVVLDLNSEAIIGKIPGSDVHGIAVVRDLGRGFISATDPGLGFQPLLELSAERVSHGTMLDWAKQLPVTARRNAQMRFMDPP